MEYTDFLEVKIPDKNDSEIIDDLQVEIKPTDDSPFIVANTEASTLQEIIGRHIIPVFVKDNEPLISHGEFIESMMNLASDVFSGEHILQPVIRVSHPIKGRTPDAKDKPAKDLLESEKTLYYERSAFVIEIPSIKGIVGENKLSLTVGGVKSYSQDNLYSKKGADQHFKVFIGFKNTLCTNLCIWTDGYREDLKVKSLGELKACMRTMIENYNSNYHLFNMQQLSRFTLNEKQFSFLVGRCRMYQYLPLYERNRITPFGFGDQQLGAVVKDYFKDKSFSKDVYGNIDLWRLYNLFTGVNKSSYIDSFLDKAVNAYQFVDKIRLCIEGKDWSWFISPSL